MPNDQIEVEGLAGISTADKKKIAAVNRNDNAIVSLTLVFSTDNLISIIMNA